MVKHFRIGPFLEGLQGLWFVGFFLFLFRWGGILRKQDAVSDPTY